MSWGCRIQSWVAKLLLPIVAKKSAKPLPEGFQISTRPPDAETPSKCFGCGRCCKIYLSTHLGGAFPEDFVDFDTHADKWMDKFVDAGVMEKNKSGEMVPTQAMKDMDIEPLHNPKKPGEPTLHPWVDVNLCQFCHPVTGCMIPRPNRPELCNRFMC